jgi:hypothetical protein
LAEALEVADTVVDKGLAVAEVQEPTEPHQVFLLLRQVLRSRLVLVEQEVRLLVAHHREAMEVMP